MNTADEGHLSEKEEKLFLELIAKNIWRARREGAILGVIYSVVVSALLWVAVATLGLFTPISGVIYAGCVTLLIDFWRRAFREQ